MIRALTLAACLACAVLAGACGQKGDLKLPAAKTQSATPGTAPPPSTPPAPK